MHPQRRNYDGHPVDPSTDSPRIRVIAAALLVVLAATGLAASLVRDNGPPHSLAGTTPRASLRVDVNTADVGALELLPRIGSTLATRIVEHREARGPFARVEDLERVRGIGPKTVERLRDHVAFSVRTDDAD